MQVTATRGILKEYLSLHMKWRTEDAWRGRKREPKWGSGAVTPVGPVLVDGFCLFQAVCPSYHCTFCVSLAALSQMPWCNLHWISSQSNTVEYTLKPSFSKNSTANTSVYRESLYKTRSCWLASALWLPLHVMASNSHVLLTGPCMFIKSPARMSYS